MGIHFRMIMFAKDLSDSFWVLDMGGMKDDINIRIKDTTSHEVVVGLVQYVDLAERV